MSDVVITQPITGQVTVTTGADGEVNVQEAAAPSQIGVVADAIPGPQGNPGPQGDPGQPRWSGQGVPGTIVGAEPGDVYLDIVTGITYVLE